MSATRRLCAACVLLWLGALLPASANAGQAPVTIATSDGEAVALYKGSHALLVGVGDYTAGWPKLESVTRELKRVEAALTLKGFEVTTAFDTDAERLRKAFRDFINAYGYDPANRLLFFFSGHGHTRQDGVKGYLVPADAPLPQDNEVGFLQKALSMNDIMAWARSMEAKHALFLFDSCFSGTVFKTKALPPVPPDIRSLTGEPVRQFITAGGAGEEVPAQSVFAPAVIDALVHEQGDLNKDGYVTGTELGLHLQKLVPQHARQTPQFGKIADYELSRGDFVFALREPGPAAGGTVADEGAAERLFWESVKESTNPADFTAYLDRYPNGVFAPLARIRLEGGAQPAQTPQAEATQPTDAATEEVASENEPKPPKSVPDIALLIVRSNVAGDMVFINDVEQRATGPTAFELAPGRYAIRVEKAGFIPFEQTIQLETGAEQTLRAVLAPHELPAPRIEALNINPSSVEPGQSAELSWRVAGASRVELQPFGSVDASGSTTVEPNATTRYTLTAFNAQDQAVSKTLELRVDKPEVAAAPVVELTAAPASIAPGAPTVLSWQTANAASVTIDRIGDVALAGEATVAPEETTTYTLSARNAHGDETTKSVRVTVVAPEREAAPTPASDESIKLAKPDYEFPGDGARRRDIDIKSFCCNGKTATVDDQSGRTVGYIYFYKTGRTKTTGRGSFAKSLSIGVSGATNPKDPSSPQREAWIDFKGYELIDAKKKRPSKSANIGGLSYEVTITDAGTTVFSGVRYFERHSVKAQVRVTVGG